MAVEYVEYEPRGGSLDIFYAKEREVVAVGPAGTGKSRACLEKLHLLAKKFPGMKAAIVRKTRESITSSCQVVFEQYVIANERFPLSLHKRDNRYYYPNGSWIGLFGLDDPKKVMSSEYDIIYANEATDLDLGDWESLLTRLRGGVMPWKQLLGDCNPQHPTHWLKARADEGKIRLLLTRHEDNPAATPEYLAILDTLTGVRYERLRLGKWVAAEGQIYAFRDSEHIVYRKDSPAQPNWRRIWSLDFGFNDPTVWQCWAVAPTPDKTMVLEWEIYRSQRIVADIARDVIDLANKKHLRRPDKIVCDHDLEDRKTFERYTNLKTFPARKAIIPGIQAVQERLKVDGRTGRPRLLIVRDCDVYEDPELKALHRPLSVKEEFAGYVWKIDKDGKVDGDEPVDRDNHGLDALRYSTSEVDEITVGRKHRKFHFIEIPKGRVA